MDFKILNAERQSTTMHRFNRLSIKKHHFFFSSSSSINASFTRIRYGLVLFGRECYHLLFEHRCFFVCLLLHCLWTAVNQNNKQTKFPTTYIIYTLHNVAHQQSPHGQLVGSSVSRHIDCSEHFSKSNCHCMDSGHFRSNFHCNRFSMEFFSNFNNDARNRKLLFSSNDIYATWIRQNISSSC